MARGKRLPGGQGDSFVVEFAKKLDGAETVSWATTTTESAAIVNFTADESDHATHYHISTPCRIEKIVVQGRPTVAADQLRVRVRRTAAAAPTTHTDLVSNSVDGSAVVDYVRQVGATAGAIESVEYKDVQSQGSTATTFVEAQAEFAVGDELSVTTAMAAEGDKFTHGRVHVWLARLD